MGILTLYNVLFSQRRQPVCHPRILDLGMGRQGFSQTLQVGANEGARRQPGPPFPGHLFLQAQHHLRKLAGGSLPLNIQARPNTKEK